MSLFSPSALDKMKLADDEVKMPNNHGLKNCEAPPFQIIILITVSFGPFLYYAKFFIMGQKIFTYRFAVFSFSSGTIKIQI